MIIFVGEETAGFVQTFVEVIDEESSRKAERVISRHGRNQNQKRH